MIKKIFIIFFIVLSGTLLLGRLDRTPLKEQYSTSQALFASKGELLRLTLGADEIYRIWLPLGQFPKEFVEAVQLKEDRWFHYHLGFNPYALGRSFVTSFLIGGSRSGGSTITMQLARLHYKLDTRSVLGKLKQVFASLWLESLYSKNEILEAYLNIVPMGRNIEGYATGSYVYFKKKLKELSISENLALIQFPQNPSPISLLKGQGKLPEKYLSSWRNLFQKWLKVHPNDESLRPSFARPLLLTGLDQLPFLAPHFTTSILNEISKNEIEIRTTLSTQLQEMTEEKLHRYIETKKKRGIKNAAAMIMRWSDGHILASIGSADFFDNSISGQVDGTLSKRSPGSTLKPFLYALAISQGLIHPQSLVYDLPQDFSAPGNIDGQFLGPITASDALIKSRNVPAADLLRKLDHHGLYAFLKTAGISQMKDEGHYGTSLIMGSLDLTMKELVGLYGLLAANGKQILPTWKFQKSKTQSEVTLLSAESSVLIKDILKNVSRPEGAARSEGMIDSSGDVYWKTGTSVGYRDAWTLGIWDDYVVAVWVGDFAGAGHPEYQGIKSAAPLFFSLIDGLQSRHHPTKSLHHSWASNVVEIEVCELSGDIPSRFCPHKKKTLFIPGVSPIHVCQTHRPVEVLADSGLRSCENSSGDRKTKVFEFWNSQALSFFKSRKLARLLPPDYAPECNLLNQQGSDREPRIISPRLGLRYQVPLREKTALIPLQSITDTDVKEVFWFVGKRLMARGIPDEDRELRLPPGKHMIKLVDDHGRATERFIQVQVATQN